MSAQTGDASEATAQLTLGDYQIQRSKRERVGRTESRQVFWSVHDYDEYECADCGAGAESVRQFEVHHKDRDPTNTAFSNHVGLCWECHLARHDKSPNWTEIDLERWKREFAALGGEP